MARQVPESLGGQANDKAADRSMQRAALLKSLEYLYFEACSAKISLVATLIGAAVEALKDDVAAMRGVVRPLAASGAVEIVDTALPRMLVDGDEFLDRDMMDDIIDDMMDSEDGSDDDTDNEEDEDEDKRH
ncbi:MAG TPA: hypothetical protein VI113_01815 [Alphaproteobacteria bacterium]